MTHRPTHLDESGNIQMVDVTERPETERGAIARARVRMAPHTVRLIEQNQISKGSVLEVAKIAAIMAAKQTPQLIPLCHPLPMTHIDVQFALDEEQKFKAEARRNKLLGLWVADKLGITGDAASAYARDVIAADFEQPGDNDVVHKVMRDLAAKNVALTEPQLRAQMDVLMAQATAQVKAGT